MAHGAFGGVDLGAAGGWCQGGGRRGGGGRGLQRHCICSHRCDLVGCQPAAEPGHGARPAGHDAAGCPHRQRARLQRRPGPALSAGSMTCRAVGRVQLAAAGCRRHGGGGRRGGGGGGRRRGSSRWWHCARLYGRRGLVGGGGAHVVGDGQRHRVHTVGGIAVSQLGVVGVSGRSGSVSKVP